MRKTMRILAVGAGLAAGAIIGAAPAQAAPAGCCTWDDVKKGFEQVGSDLSTGSKDLQEQIQKEWQKYQKPTCSDDYYTDENGHETKVDPNNCESSDQTIYEYDTDTGTNSSSDSGGGGFWLTDPN